MSGDKYRRPGGRSPSGLESRPSCRSPSPCASRSETPIRPVRATDSTFSRHLCGSSCPGLAEDWASRRHLQHLGSPVRVGHPRAARLYGHTRCQCPRASRSHASCVDASPLGCAAIRPIAVVSRPRLRSQLTALWRWWLPVRRFLVRSTVRPLEQVGWSTEHSTALCRD